MDMAVNLVKTLVKKYPKIAPFFLVFPDISLKQTDNVLYGKYSTLLFPVYPDVFLGIQLKIQ